MVKVVNKGLKVEILPDETKKQVLNQNIGNARFIWNNILARYNYIYMLFCFYGYSLNPNINNLNAILKMLKQEHAFLREGESTSQQQVFRDLNNAFTRFFKGKSAYPKFKSKKIPNNHSGFKKTETICASQTEEYDWQKSDLSTTEPAKNIANY